MELIWVGLYLFVGLIVTSVIAYIEEDGDPRILVIVLIWPAVGIVYVLGCWLHFVSTLKDKRRK